MKKSNFTVFFGIFLVSMLFVPPGIPFMDPVPEAEAAHSSNLQGAITDLSLVSVVDYDPPFSSALRNNITLSWSEPNDNGSPITYYIVQAKGTSGNWVKLDHMEPTITTYTHTTVVNVQLQYRVWAVGPDGCHGNTTTYYDTLPCNEGNILSVVSAYGGGILPPKAGCDNEHLDDCGYWDDETAPTVTVPDDMTYNTINSSGRSISWQEGWAHPFGTEITVTDDVGIAGSDGYLTCNNSPPVPSPINQGSTMLYDQIFPVGTTTVTCQGTDTSSNTTFTSFDVTINYTPLTINWNASDQVSVDGNNWKYGVTGDSPPSANLTFTLIKPDGSVGNSDSSSRPDPSYDHGGIISPTSSVMYGTWTLKLSLIHI